MVREDSSSYLQRVYSATDNRELKEAYDQWAEKYDANVTAFGYMTPAVAAGLFGKYVTPETTPILDAGAGTGLMGAILDSLGYRGQVGIDISAGMLNKASYRGVYIPNGYKDKFEVMENDGKWQLMEKTKQFPGLPLEDPNKLIRVYVYRVC